MPLEDILLILKIIVAVLGLPAAIWACLKVFKKKKSPIEIDIDTHFEAGYELCTVVFRNPSNHPVTIEWVFLEFEGVDRPFPVRLEGTEEEPFIGEEIGTGFRLQPGITGAVADLHVSWEEFDAKEMRELKQKMEAANTMQATAMILDYDKKIRSNKYTPPELDGYIQLKPRRAKAAR